MQHNFDLLAVAFVLLLVKLQRSTGEECVNLQELESAIPCCEVHLLLSTHKIGKVCSAENRHLKNSGDLANWSMCHHKCFAEKAGAIIGETVHVEQFYKYADYFREPISTAYRAAIERCSLDKIPGGTANGKWTCSTLAANFDTCILFRLALSCPEELRSDEKVCRLYRERVPICKQ